MSQKLTTAGWERVNFCAQPANSPKQKKDQILGYVAQNGISSTPNTPATTQFWWFPTLKIALTDT